MHKKQLTRLMRAKVRIARIAFPVWAVVLALAGVAGVAGQAVGPVLDGQIKGLVGMTIEQSILIENIEFRDYPPTLLYSVSQRDDQLRIIDTSDVIQTTGSVAITLAGEIVEGANGLASDPTDNDKLYAILKLQGQAGRQLVTIDPATGVATSIGNTGDRFGGLAFSPAGVLYDVTGDGAGVPETLYTLNKATAVPTFVMTLGNGNDGETIAFSSNDGLLYHASGDGTPNVNEIFESINTATLGVTSITLRGQDYSEATVIAYEGADTFFLADLGRRLYRINTDGVSQFEGIIDHDTKGLSPFDLAHVDDSIVLINDEGTAFTAAIESHIGDSYMLILTLENNSDADANAMLELDVPKEIDVEVEAVGSIAEAQLARRTWALNVPSTLTEGKLRLIFSPRDESAPDFYNVTGRLVQVSH